MKAIFHGLTSHLQHSLLVRGNSLVGADTGGFQSLGAQLFILVGNQVNAEREFVNVGALATEIEDTDLRVGDTTVESGLWVWL